jgi:hypothetical protein
LHLRPDKTLTDLARIFNPIIQGWINYGSSRHPVVNLAGNRAQART